MHPLDPEFFRAFGCLVWSFFVLKYYATSKALRADKYHTFWPRFLGPNIDELALWLPLTLAPYLIVEHLGVTTERVQAVLIITGILYFAYSICMHARFGATLGKMGTKIRVVRAKDETPIGWRHAILRDLVPLVLVISLFAVPVPEASEEITIAGETYVAAVETSHLQLYLGFTLIGWFLIEVITMFTNSKRRALHDFIAGTVVVRINLKDPSPGPVTFSDGGRLETANTPPIQNPYKSE